MENATDLLTLMYNELKEMVRFYSADPELRAANGGDCAYLDSHGNKCAIGRMLTLEDLARLEARGFLFDTALSDVWGIIETPRVKNLPIRFLEDLQELHDNDTYWDSSISERGMEYAEKIEEKIRTRVYA